MRNHVIVLVTLGFIALAPGAARADDTQPQARPLMSGEHMAKLREEIRLNEQRAHEIEPILARDRQASASTSRKSTGPSSKDTRASSTRAPTTFAPTRARWGGGRRTT